MSHAVRHIGLLVYDRMQALDLVGPVDVFGSANGRAANAAYVLHTIGLSRAAVRCENGLLFSPDVDLASAPPLDTLFIPGGAGSRLVLSHDGALRAWLRERSESTRRMVSVCTGAFILAATGLLDGRRATTHWRHADEFAQRFPAVRLDPDQIHLHDGKFHSSGGLTAGMDLALALIESDLGAGAALAVARDLVMYVKRPGNQAQFSAPLEAQTRGEGRFAGLVQWLLEHLHEDLGVERLAERSSMSVRNFARVFRERFGSTPARFVERLRLERACVLLTSGRDSIERIAGSTGFASADVLRRAFRARYGASPLEYRQRFGG
jgi:transcriptional regulator GlxA family with amidase domain